MILSDAYAIGFQLSRYQKQTMNDFWSNMFRCLVIVLTLFSWNVSCVDCQSPRRGDPQCPDKPNIIVIVADDMVSYFILQ